MTNPKLWQESLMIIWQTLEPRLHPLGLLIMHDIA
jgi:hypothetical protein